MRCRLRGIVASFPGLVTPLAFLVLPVLHPSHLTPRPGALPRALAPAHGVPDVGGLLTDATCLVCLAAWQARAATGPARSAAPIRRGFETHAVEPGGVPAPRPACLEECRPRAPPVFPEASAQLVT